MCPLYFKGALATLWFWPSRNANARSCQSSTHASQFPNANGLDSCPVMVSFRLPFHRGLVSWQFSLFRSFSTEGKKEEKTLTHLSLSWPDTHLVDSNLTFHFFGFMWIVYWYNLHFVQSYFSITTYLAMPIIFDNSIYILFGTKSWFSEFRPIWNFKCLASIRY